MASKKEKELEAAIEERCQEIENSLDASLYLRNVVSDEIAKYIPSDMQGSFKNMISYVEKFSTVMKYHELPKKEYKGYSIKELERGRVEKTKEPIDKELFEQATANTQSFIATMELLLQQNAAYKNLTFAELKEQSLDPKNKTLIAGSLLDKIFKETEEILKTSIQADLVENEIERIKHFPIKEIKTPVDKTNKLFFGINPPQPKKDINGQLEFVPVSVGNDSKQIAVYYSYFVDNDLLERLGIANKIWQKDFTICSVINGFRESGNNIITFSQLHKALGNRTRPNSTQLQKLQDNCTKLLSTTIMLDTKELAEAYNLENYNEFIGSLLPIAIVNEKAYINGQLVEGYIKILDEPPLITLAKKTNQITSISPKLLEVDIKHNDMFYAIFNYLVREISHIKNPSYIRKNKILYSSIYAELDIEGTTEKERKARDRAKTTIFKILDHFKTNDYITDYKEETTASTGKMGVIISFDK